MEFLQIRLLGQFQVLLDGEIVSDFVSDKVRALLTYLAVERHHPHRREGLAHLLWPDKPYSRARANLRSALANLRQVVGDSHAEVPYFLVTHHDVQFNLHSRVLMDVEILSGIHDLEPATAENMVRHAEALDLYKGEFLSGFNLLDSPPFDTWARMKREHYDRMMAAILQRSSDYYDQQGDYEAALPFAWRNVELAPWQERARFQLIRLLVYSGRRDEALQQYVDFESILQEELNIRPGAQFQQLYKNLLAGEENFRLDDSKMYGNGLVSLPEFLREEDGNVLPHEPFVARHQELKRLHAQLDDMMEGRGRILMVAGEAGSGKTMLVREFVRQAQTRYPDLVSAAGCGNVFTGKADPYLPFREILYQLCGDIQAYWKAGSHSRQYALNLWNMIPVACRSLVKYGPDLIDTILPGQTLLESAESYSRNSPAWYIALKEHLQARQRHPGSAIQQANLFSQIAVVLQKIATQAPLLLFLDDLQWADHGTISLLFHFISKIRGSRILLIGAYRSEDVGLVQENDRHPLAPVLHEIKRNFGDITINLDASPGMLFIEEFLASEPNALDEHFRKQLFSLTGGHALFTVEMLRNMQESNVLARNQNGAWILISELHWTMFPPQIEGIIVQRISRLPRNLQRILTLASIEGEMFTAEIIAAVEGLPVQKIVSSLSEQMDKQHRLVKPQQISWQGDQSISTYRFRHSLFQKYIYNGLDAIQRSRLHEEVGREMEKIAGEKNPQFAVNLARHFHAAGQTGKALTYYTLAGERAVRMSAYPEAIVEFEAAIELLSGLPESPARNEKELDLQLQLGLAYQATSGFASEKVGAAYRRARELSEHVDDPVKSVTTLHLLSSYYANTAEFDTVNEVLKLLEKRYDELGEPFSDDAQLVNWGYGYVEFLTGQIKSASEYFERALDNYHPGKHDSISKQIGMDAGIYCHNWAGLTAAWLGYPDQAKAHVRAAWESAERYESKLFMNDALWFSTWISLELEDIAAARTYLEPLLQLTARERYLLFDSVARMFEGRILVREGQHEKAIARIIEGLEMFYTTEMVTMHPLFLHALAEAFCAAGRVSDGFDTILKAEQIMAKTGEAWNKSAILKIKGDLYRMRGAEKDAEKCYLHSIETAQQQSIRLIELVAANSLAQLWLRQDKAEEAGRLLQPLIAWFTEGFDLPIWIEARKLLADLVL